MLYYLHMKNMSNNADQFVDGRALLLFFVPFVVDTACKLWYTLSIMTYNKKGATNLTHTLSLS